LIRPRYGQVDNEYGMKLATTDPADDGPVWMVNLMESRDDFKDKHKQKDAGMERIFVIGCQPRDPQPGLGLEGRTADWSTVEHPPTAEDGLVYVLHVIKWNDHGAETMQGYHEEAFRLARRRGHDRPVHNELRQSFDL
jgi:hypothetical protein